MKFASRSVWFFANDSQKNGESGINIDKSVALNTDFVSMPGLPSLAIFLSSLLANLKNQTLWLANCIGISEE